MEQPKEITSKEVSEFVKNIPWLNRGDEQPKESWTDEFDKKFYSVGNFANGGAIYGKDHSMSFDKDGSQIGAIKIFIQDTLEQQKAEFLNQPANHHDQEVRKELKKEIIEGLQDSNNISRHYGKVMCSEQTPMVSLNDVIKYLK